MDREQLDISMKLKMLAYLETFITEHKAKLFGEVIPNRTKHMTVVLEDIYQSQNASAVLRTCDCFGIQDIHIIENRYTYSINPDVALGSSKWLNLHKYSDLEQNTIPCYDALRKDGYRIVATSPHKGDVLLDDLEIKNKFALVFGTELEGLSDTAIQEADEYVKIPMYGFTESFNISVSAAICIHHLSQKLRSSEIKWQLNEEEMIDTRLSWVKSVIKHPDVYEKEFMRKEGLI